MRYVPVIAVLVVAMLGCDMSKSTNSGNNNNANVAKPSATVEPKLSQSVAPEPTPKAGITAILKKSAGKYPYALKLFDNEEMSSRLQKMMGADFAAMKANWDVETPIEIKDGILMTSGCEQHNCGGNTYYMFVDLAKDNINVYHLENGKQTYTENGKIDLPGKFAAELNSAP